MTLQWTYSRLDKFETCPRQFYHVHVSRDVVEPPTEATIWGEKVHSAFEYRIKDGTPLPEGMLQWEGLAKKIAAMPGEKLCEERLAVDHNFQPVEWKQAWSRGIADVVNLYKDTATVLDYKTGKRKLTDQLALYAVLAFAQYPQIQTVKTGFVWLKDRKIDKETVHRDEIPVVWTPFLARVRKLESAYERDKWPHRPSGLCNGWCPVKQCEFYKPKK